MNPALKATLTTVAGLIALAPAAFADTRNQGYLVDQNYNIVTAVGGTVCVRTSDWTPARAAAADPAGLCDRDLVPKPAPAAAQPAPAPKKEPAKPVVKDAPPKPSTQKINFSADALFDFNKADLRPAGKAMLDDLTRLLQGAKFEVILAIGHTDRIGSLQYNQKLSVKRAETVKNYLVGKGFEPNRVYAEGKGKTQPLTKPGDCRGKKAAALIACLQPDRRVDVEVTGSK